MSRGRLLLVDDDPHVRMVAEISLGEVGTWSVVAVQTAAEALEAAAGQTFDAVVLDASMPDMDGPELLGALRDGPLGADVPVVFLTGRVLPAEQEALIAAGARGVLGKPFDPMALPGELDALLAG